MPSFKYKNIGDFDAKIEPVGWLRSFFLTRRFVPYFAGDEPQMKLSIQSVRNSCPSIQFTVLLYSVLPGTKKDSVMPSPFFQRHASTPFVHILAFPMLSDDGNYEYELEIRSNQGAGGSSRIAMLPVATMEVVLGSLIGRILLLLIGACIGAGLTFLVQYLLTSPQATGQ